MYDFDYTNNKRYFTKSYISVYQDNIIPILIRSITKQKGFIREEGIRNGFGNGFKRGIRRQKGIRDFEDIENSFENDSENGFGNRNNNK